jgi:acetyl esterase/lipase
MLATQMGIPLCPDSTPLVGGWARGTKVKALCVLTTKGGKTDPREVLTRAAPRPDFVLRYGPGREHVADLRLPAGGGITTPGQGPGAPLIVLLHGGFWRAAYDRAHAGPLASALAQAGYAVCVPEYRRTGQRGGGWPGTFDDVAAAVDTLPGLAAEAAPGQVDPAAVLLAGHSAGGHLALWAASRNRLPADTAWHRATSPVRGVVALAAVSDLAAGAERDLGRGAAVKLMDGGPERHPGRYAQADPARLVPAPVPVRLVHGELDDVVPCAMSLDYAARAARAGWEVACDALPGFGHFEVIDPLTGAWPHVLSAFHSLVMPPGPSASGLRDT